MSYFFFVFCFFMFWLLYLLLNVDNWYVSTIMGNDISSYYIYPYYNFFHTRLVQ